MNAALSDTALWLTVLWPLLLAIPALHKRLPFPCHLAILPALLLVVLFTDATVTMPWLLLGSGLVIDGGVRWILAMSVSVWLMAATVMKGSKHAPVSDHMTTLFLLTLAGNMGTLLASDLMSFFSFSVLMGYGLYGLLIYGGDQQVHRAGRIYLICLILADLALFEALLLAASTTGDLRFEVVQQVMGEASFVQLYLAMVLAGFTLKAGIWPFSLWLTSAFNAASLSRSLLLGAVPVAMALLGAARWLPVGEYSFSTLGMIIQMMGGLAVLYAAFRFFTYPYMKLFPAYGAIVDSGIFVAMLGVGLSYPATWHEYEYLIHPYIAALGIFLALLSVIISRLQSVCHPPDRFFLRGKVLSLLAFRKVNMLGQWAKARELGANSMWGIALQAGAQCLERLDGLMDGWSSRIIMLVLLGLLLAWMAM